MDKCHGSVESSIPEAILSHTYLKTRSIGISKEVILQKSFKNFNNQVFYPSSISGGEQ
jgi:hypothetical protein